MRRVRHRIDRVDDLADLGRVLADAEIARCREAEHVDRHAHAERMQPRCRVGEERSNRCLHRLWMRAGITDDREVTVAREAHIVELDLVEACVCSRHRDVDVVAPGGPGVRVEPGEAAVRPPERAVASVNRKPGMRGRRDRVLERDDTADQVDACFVRLGRDRLRVVVGAGGAVLDGNRGSPLDERDAAGFVFHVDLDGVQAGLLQGQVLPEAPGQAHEGPGHVHATDLLRQCRAELAPRHRGAHRLQPDTRGSARVEEKRHQAEEGGAAEQGQQGHRGQAPAADLAPAQLALISATLGVVDVRGDCHEGPGW